MVMDLSTRSDLIVDGVVHPDDPASQTVTARVIGRAEVLRAGRGALVVDVTINDLALRRATLIWIVTTNKGWAHLRGLAETDGREPARPFRADLFSSAAIGEPGPDRLAVRLYAPTDDPNVASPTHKLQGWLAAGSVRLGRYR